eukprot:3730729-Amphidinium_carterae.1
MSAVFARRGILMIALVNLLLKLRRRPPGNPRIPVPQTAEAAGPVLAIFAGFALALRRAESRPLDTSSAITV